MDYYGHDDDYDRASVCNLPMLPKISSLDRLQQSTELLSAQKKLNKINI